MCVSNQREKAANSSHLWSWNQWMFGILRFAGSFMPMSVSQSVGPPFLVQTEMSQQLVDGFSMKFSTHTLTFDCCGNLWTFHLAVRLFFLWVYNLPLVSRTMLFGGTHILYVNRNVLKNLFAWNVPIEHWLYLLYNYYQITTQLYIMFNTN